MVNGRDQLIFAPPNRALPPVEWRSAATAVPYEAAVSLMESRALDIVAGRAVELVWLLEHPPLYTSGTGAKPGEVIEARFPVHQTGRGGQTTYHGPGQRVVYAMLDLKRRGPDLRRYVATLEEWIIRTLAAFNVRGERRDDRIGVWVRRPEKGKAREDKIAALGIRVKQWVTMHGIAINVDPDLSHFAGIVPCGVSSQSHGVTSLAELGLTATMEDVDAALRREFEILFGPTTGYAVGSTENFTPALPGVRSSAVPSR